MSNLAGLRKHHQRNNYIKLHCEECRVAISEHREAWLCQSVGYLRDEPVDDATFSSDGSLLAVVYGQVSVLRARTIQITGSWISSVGRRHHFLTIEIWVRMFIGC